MTPTEITVPALPEFVVSCDCGYADEDDDRDALTQRHFGHIDRVTGRRCRRDEKWNG